MDGHYLFDGGLGNIPAQQNCRKNIMQCKWSNGKKIEQVPSTSQFFFMFKKTIVQGIICQPKKIMHNLKEITQHISAC